MMLLKTVSTMTSECFLVRSETRDTSSTSSAFVMLPPAVVVTLCSSRPRASGPRPQNDSMSEAGPRDPGPGSRGLPVPEMIPQRGRAGALAVLICLPIGAELIALERTDAEADLPFLRAQL